MYVPRQLMPTLESQLDKRLKRMLDIRGAEHWQTTNLTSIYRGLPDRFVLYKGAFIAIELKGDATPHQSLQAIKRKRIRDAGGISFYARGEAGLRFIEWLLDTLDDPMSNGTWPGSFRDYVHREVQEREGVGL